MKRFLSIILASVILISGTGVSYGIAPIQGKAQDQIAGSDLEFLNSVLEMIEEKYPFQADKDELINGGIKGILRTLDPHSDYYTKDESESLLSMTTGEIVGIGVVIELKDGIINVKELIPGSPAERAGLEVGDKIVSVNYESLIGLTLPEVSNRIKGKMDTVVKITVARGEGYLDFDIKREKIKINPVKFQMLEGNIGYMKIDEFSKGLWKYTNLGFMEMDNRGSKKLLLDLRNNPGGLLNEALELSDTLLPKGDMVHVRYKDEVDTYKSKTDGKQYDIIVLVNENSASAAEIVAGAIKDRGVGKLVGRRTYGKATIQSVIPISDGSIVKMTIGEYLTPGKKPIDGVGIEVDYEIKNTGTEDMQLKKAIELLRKK